MCCVAGRGALLPPMLTQWTGEGARRTLGLSAVPPAKNTVAVWRLALPPHSVSTRFDCALHNVSSAL
jgi:hypothetical protein